MNTLVSSNTINNEPIKCTLTKIEDEFINTQYYQQYNTGILKNYVYNPERRLIA